METNKFEIRAKKISELDYYPSIDESLDRDYGYVIIGYNDNVHRQNYKISLKQLIKLVGTPEIDDNTLRNKINEFIRNNQIDISSTEGAQGPQGAQGSSAAFDDSISGLQSRIDTLYEYLGLNAVTYQITYKLLYVNSKSSNPTTIKQNTSITVSFTPSKGYKLPNSISVSGCQFTYNKASNSITLSNPTSDVIINMTGEIQYYSISYSFTNITYTITRNEKTTYQNEETVELLLTPAPNYKLPSTISATNCTKSYNVKSDGTATLTLTCSGTGNMSVSGTAISTINYYFGCIAVEDSSISVAYNYFSNGEFEGLKSVSVSSTSKLSSSTSCPFNVSSGFTINNVGSSGDIILIVPANYFDNNTNEFKNNSGARYKLYPANFAFVPMDFPSEYKCDTMINGVLHYAIWIENQTNGASYIFKN